MIVGVDASNIRGGGGLTHLANLLAHAQPEAHGISRFRVWSARSILDQLPERSWLEKCGDPLLEGGVFRRLWFQRFRLPALAREHCDLLFVPGGNASRGFSPVVTMSRNMLPFEPEELRRYGLSPMGLRLLLLRFGQASTFRHADGIVFLTRYAHDVVRRAVAIRGAVEIIPHGVEERFRREPRPARPLESCSFADPLRIVYVSPVDEYKHQWNVAEAVARLRDDGLPLDLELAGKSYPAALRRLHATLERVDPRGGFVHYRGPVPFREVHDLYRRAELFVFASSCENMPNVLLEAMASGLPIACARRGPMPAMLGDAGVYFDPDDAASIAEAVRSLATDAGLRERCARDAFARSAEYSWERCAARTLDFVGTVATARRAVPERTAKARPESPLEERRCES